MATKKFLDNDGLLYLWTKIKDLVSKSVPTKVSELTNDSQFITINDVPEGAVASSTNPKMAGTATSGTETAFARGDHVHPSDSTKADKSSLATVATSGSYTDLINKPTIPTVPTKVSAFTNDSGYLTSHQDISGKANKATTLAGYGITNAYTKTEIDSKLGSVFNYKGTVASASALPASAVKGDVYNVTAAGGKDASGVAIKAGDNVVYNGRGWDVLSGTVDLSGYVQASDKITNADIDTIVAS